MGGSKKTFSEAKRIYDKFVDNLSLKINGKKAEAFWIGSNSGSI